MRFRFCTTPTRGAVKTLLHAFSAVALWMLLMGACVTSALAQGFEVEGRVVSATDGTALPGANVVEVGTQNGTTTNVDGDFTLVVSDPNDSLRVSFVGFEPTTVGIDGRSNITIELQESLEQLGEMVVTAFGIERQRRSVGYATSQVDAAELVNVAEPNPIEMLQGKVPGLIIDPNAGGVGSASQTTIRGISNLSGENEPLYIVDGIPIVNNPIGGGAGAAGSSAGQYGGFSATSPLSVINSDNIQNISVLKGAGAAALYGIRARDGVILISTKSGRRATAGENFSVQYSSTLTARDVLNNFADFQDAYGKGSRGLPPEDQQEAYETSLSSWGAPFEGEFATFDESMQFDGNVRPYEFVTERGGIYETGLQFKNALSFSGAYENLSFRLSASHLNAEDVVPSSGYEQTTVAMRGQSTFGKLTADANVTYSREEANDRSYLGTAERNPNFLIAFMPGNVPTSALEPGYTEDGTELQYSNNIYLTNPYWVVNRFEADDDNNRILGGIQLNYDILDWLSVLGSTGLDWSLLKRTYIDPYGTAFRPTGSMNQSEYTQWESNTRAMLTAEPELTGNLSVRVDLGGNVRYEQFERLGAFGDRFNVPFFNDVSNLANRTPIYDFSEQQVNSFFGAAAFNYSDFLYLTVTGRNDWASTLPEKNNRFFYPSVSGSFVFSEFMPRQDWMSYGKIRAAWGEVGGAADDPYQLFLNYCLPGSHQGVPLGNVCQTVVPNFDLEPTSTRETELGFETQFFDDRFGIDFTWYTRSTTKQIIEASVSVASGYVSRIINTGEVDNSGVELLLTGTPLATDNWLWDTSLNFGAGTSEVISLAEDQDIRFDATGAGTSVSIVQIPGEKVNAIYGTTYVRDHEGNIVVNEQGIPLQGDRKVLGNGAPDWALGFTNSFSYKNFSLTILMDAKWGGQLFSQTNNLAYGYGLHQNTLEGRAECDAVRDPETGYPTTGCWRPPNTVLGHTETNEAGEQVVVVDDEDGVAVDPQEWYGGISGRIAEEFVYDANYIMLRQMRISYQLPERWLIRTPIADATISLVGRNLFYLYDSVPNVSPESSYNAAVTPGIETPSVPQARSFGFSLNARF